ncbi:hypothetical protein QTI24_29160 [Variovorax sp. J22P240]|uniref:hypothetical protein n=1 Tax=Variovorax sp. J22P240 TaxID=3053514 RepID=UPI002578B620|nr:hypothetical protein [Variovorax sp. J22P240]MDM0002702.1 hypothetical protein [Variovorax sp. J22P240]
MATDDEADPWAALVAAATRDVEHASKGDSSEGRRVLFLATVAWRNLLDRGAQPSPRDAVFLRAVLESLEATVKGGVDANKALHLINPSHRPPAKEDLRDVRLALFIAVGEEYDRLTTLGRTRADAPLREAFRTVARKNTNEGSNKKMTLAIVQKAWSVMGALDGWKAWKELESDSH